MAWGGRRYLRAFVGGFFVAVPVTVTALDRLAYVARVEGASMQPFLNPEGGSDCDVVLLNRWSVRNYEVRRGDIVSVMSPKNPQQKIIKRVIGLEGDFIRTLSYKNRYVRVPDGHFWIEGDHHGHSLDSNSFGPLTLRIKDEQDQGLREPKTIRIKGRGNQRRTGSKAEGTKDDQDQGLRELKTNRIKG
ncbi:mitochondrial inner membrane protease subunit 2 isoform 2-T6 [Spinachia spinachia]